MGERMMLCCPEFNDLGEEMWEIKRLTDLTRLLGDPEKAKRAANFLLATSKLSRFRHANEPTSEDDALERHNIEDAEAKDIPKSRYTDYQSGAKISNGLQA